MKRYLVVPGMVISKSDGNAHYVTSADLIRLYRVRPYQCVVFYPMRPGQTPEEIALRDGLRILRPQYDGDYKL